MANAITTQEVIAIFQRYTKEVTLKPPKDNGNFSPWTLELNHDDPSGDRIVGKISYPRNLLDEDGQGEVSVSLSVGNSRLFRKSYLSKPKEGWLAHGYAIPAEMQQVLEFVREADKPRRERYWYEQRKNTRHTREAEDAKKRVTEEAADDLRKRMR